MTIDAREAVADAGRVTAAPEAAAYRLMSGGVRAVLATAVPAALATGLALITAAPATAQDFFATQRDFVIEKSCEAYGSFKRRTNATPLVVGRAYPARGVNKSDAPSHAFIVIAGGGNKWVDLSCGRFADGGAPGSLAWRFGCRDLPRTSLPSAGPPARGIRRRKQDRAGCFGSRSEASLDAGCASEGARAGCRVGI